jgi:hypothetical protein
MATWHEAFGFGVDSDQIQILPHPINQFVQVPLQIPRDRDVVLYLVKDFKLLEGDGVDFVEGIQTWDVLAIALDHIDDVVFCGIALEADVSRVYAILFQDGLY